MYSSNAQPTGTNRPRACHPHPPTKKPASTIQNLNQQTRPPQPKTGGNGNNTGSPRYGGHSGQETPGPIPNPEVKPASANGTAPDRMWESRTPPNIFLINWGHRMVAPIGISWDFRCDSLVLCGPHSMHMRHGRTARPQGEADRTALVGAHAEAGAPGGDRGVDQGVNEGVNESEE